MPSSEAPAIAAAVGAFAAGLAVPVLRAVPPCAAARDARAGVEDDRNPVLAPLARFIFEDAARSRVLFRFLSAADGCGGRVLAKVTFFLFGRAGSTCDGGGGGDGSLRFREAEEVRAVSGASSSSSSSPSFPSVFTCSMSSATSPSLALPPPSSSSSPADA